MRQNERSKLRGINREGKGLMIRAFERVEEILWGKPEYELALPVLEMPRLGSFTLEDAFQNVAFIGSIRSGKTSSAKTYYQSLLLEQFGGLVLCVKANQIEEFISICRECGREGDLIILGPQEKHRFNPLEGANLVETTSLVVELADVLSNRQPGGGDNEAFWRQQCEIMVERLLTLCRAFHGHIDIVDLANMFDSRANQVSQLADPAWRQTSVMASALDMAREMAQKNKDEELRRAVHYFERDFPGSDNRLQSSLVATVSGVLENLRKPALLKVFSGKSTFTMEDLFRGGKICVVALPAQGLQAQNISPSEGQIANGLMQFCFCRAATQAERDGNVFLISDECQETISHELQRQLSVLRQSRVATVLLTQDLAALDARVGQVVREAVLSKCMTKVFLRQDHAATREWAVQQIGKCILEREAHGRSWQPSGTSRNESNNPTEDWRVRPERFGTLKSGRKNGSIVQSFVLKEGRWSYVEWHQDHPGKRGTVRIV